MFGWWITRRSRDALAAATKLRTGSGPREIIEPLEQRTLLAGNGLAAAYFNNPDLTDVKLARTDQSVSFDWSSGAPTPGVGSDYSVRWSGRVQPRFSEQYRFVTYTAGSVRLWVNDQLIIDDWTAHSQKVDSGYINLVAGQRYNIVMEYSSTGGGQSVAKLYWDSARQEKQIIPKGFLYSHEPDTQPPTGVSHLKPSYVTDTAIKMVWDAASDPTLVVFYDVYIGKTHVGTTQDLEFARGWRTPSTTYGITVFSVDPFGNRCDGAVRLVTTLSPAPAAGGTGLASKYYVGTTFDQFKMTRTDPTVDFNWSSPPIEAPNGAFSTTWTGLISPKYKEHYTFYLTSDDGARLWVNDQLIIDHWTDHPLTEDSASMTLVAGKKYGIKIEYHETGGGGTARLAWESLSQPKQTIARSQLFPDFVDSSAPTKPLNLHVTDVTWDTVSFSWDASTDDIGLIGYDVYRGTTKIATVTGLSYSDFNLNPGTTYQYKVVALDGADKSSAASDPVSATTDPAPPNRDAFLPISAASYNASSGVSKTNGYVTGFDSGDWFKFTNVDFHGGVNSVMIALALPTTNIGGSIELRVNSLTGPVIGTLVVQPTGSFVSFLTQRVAVSGASGVRDLYVIGRNRSNLANVQSIQFSTQSPVKVMALGDSITHSFTQYKSFRYYLWHKLLDAGKAVDFVGSQIQQANGYPTDFDFDQNHEGHTGIRADQVVSAVTGWANAARPDIVLIHLGTNDLRAGRDPEDVISDLGTIINKLRSVNPNVQIILAQIIPAGDAPTGSVQAFNSLIPGLAAAKNTSQSRVLVADMYSGFSLANDSDDALHPNDAGDRFMADRWYAMLDQLI